MKQRKHKTAVSQPCILFAVILLFCAAAVIREPSFFGPATLINLLRAGIFTMCFALAEMIVIIGGGIDISFPAIGCVSMCVPMFLFEKGVLPDRVLLFFLTAMLCGCLFGALNGFLVAVLHILPLVATLAVSAIASGGLILLLGGREYTTLPETLRALYETNLFVYTDRTSGFTYPMTVLIFVPVVLCIAAAFLLKYTLAGQKLKAVGGDKEAALKAGINVLRVRFFTYVLSGAVTGITAMMYTTLMHSASAYALTGDEMLVIAACVIGGCRLSGGSGTVIGTVLGVILITLIQNHLNMLGVPTAWQAFVLGVMLLLGVLLTTIKERGFKRAGRIVS